MKLTRTVQLLGAAAVMVVASARAEDAQGAKFLEDAIQTDIAEINLSELALQHSNSDGVRELAHQLQSDHSTSMQEAVALAKSLGGKIPSTPTAEAQEHYAALAKLSGPEFDASFASHMVDGHREAVAKFGQQTQASGNVVATFATKTLPTLQRHLATAESLLAEQGVHPSAVVHPAHVDPQLRPAPEVTPPTLSTRP